MSYTIALSGPERTRAQAELALETARIPILPSDHHAPMDWDRKLAPYASKEAEAAAKKSKRGIEPQAFLTVEHTDVDAPTQAVEKAGWALRVHYETPEAPKPDPLVATLAEMRAEIDALKAQVANGR